MCTHRSLSGAVIAMFEVYGAISAHFPTFRYEVTNGHVTEVGYIKRMKNATINLLPNAFPISKPQCQRASALASLALPAAVLPLPVPATHTPHVTML